MREQRIQPFDMLFSWLLIYFSGKMLFDEIPYIFELLSLGLIVFFAAAWVIYENPYSIYKVALLIFFLIFSVYIILNGFLQGPMVYLLRAAYEYIVYMLFFFAMSFIIPRANVGKCLRVFVLWGVLIAVLSWIEYITESYLVAKFDYGEMLVSASTFRAAVFSRSYLSHGAVLGFFALSSMGLFYTRKKWYWIISAAFCYISILTTASRGPLVAAGLALVIQFVLYSYASSRGSRLRLTANVILVAAILAVAVLMLGDFETSNDSINYFLHRIRSITNWRGDAGNLGRLQVWSKSIDWLKTNVLFGIGPSKTGSWGAESIGVTESGVLKRLCELGVLGFLIYYSIVAMILVKGIAVYRKKSIAGKRYMLAWIGMAVAILINDCILQVSEEIMISFFMYTAFAGISVAEEYTV